MDFERMVKVYVKMRDARAALKAEYTEKDEAIKAQMASIEEQFLLLCKETNTSSISTTYGTVTRKVNTKYFVQDWEPVYEMITQQGALDLLEKRIAQRNMEAFLKENPDLQPDGLVINREYAVTVRRK